jgi:hypothetical protein
MNDHTRAARVVESERARRLDCKRRFLWLKTPTRKRLTCCIIERFVSGTFHEGDCGHRSITAHVQLKKGATGPTLLNRVLGVVRKLMLKNPVATEQ